MTTPFHVATVSRFGDRFCLSGKVPIWFNLKKVEDLEGAEKKNDGEIDVSGIDVVKGGAFFVCIVKALCCSSLILCLGLWFGCLFNFVALWGFISDVNLVGCAENQGP
ncbi:hypothetical protein RIF29_08622 [Crotalaria pallida]|uniref:Transmembrane protein n=1 Tax=Crotalaria pallida TaxID=3830 RepID=A0AAN9FTY3_CROPI